MKRREAVKLIGGTTAGLLLPIGARGASQSSMMVTRTIPSSGEKLPVIGLGTWSVFDVDLTPATRPQLGEVLSLLVKRGGRESIPRPMDGCAEARVCNWPPNCICSIRSLSPPRSGQKAKKPVSR